MSIRELVLASQAGDQNATDEVIDRYMWLINDYSKRDGILDDDCKQTVLFEVLAAIKRYESL